MLHGRNIALVEDDEIMGASLTDRLELEGARVTWFKTFGRALGGLRTPLRPFDVVLCDIRLGDGSGEDLFLRLCEHGTPPPFLFMTGQATAEQAVRLLRSGAADYLTKPFDMAALLVRLGQIISPVSPVGADLVFGPSQAARKLQTQMVQIALSDGPVLILGESGTGKKAAARHIHGLSDRRAAPFVAVDLSRTEAAEQEQLLFGAEGALQRAQDGVLVIERIGDAAPQVQARLVQAIWDSQKRGARIMATDTDEPRLRGALRPDVFYHLNMLVLTVPPLRQRPEDIGWMLARLFDGMNARRSDRLKGISLPAEDLALRHDWPGNGRELRGRLARALAIATGDMILPADLFPEKASESEGDFSTLAEARDQAERFHIERALARTGGGVSEAAKLLQVSRTTLWEKMQKLGLSG